MQEGGGVLNLGDNTAKKLYLGENFELGFHQLVKEYKVLKIGDIV